MKKIFGFIMVIVIVLSMTTGAFALTVVEEHYIEFEAKIGCGDYGCTLQNPAYWSVCTYDTGYTVKTALLPLREVCEYLGMTVVWNQDDGSITVDREDFQEPYIYCVGEYGTGFAYGTAYVDSSSIPCSFGSGDNRFVFLNHERIADVIRDIPIS